MARFKSRLQRFKSAHVAAQFGLSTPHYMIHQALTEHFTSKARVAPDDQAFQDALLFFTRAEAEKQAVVHPEKKGIVSTSVTLHCKNHSLFHPNYDYWLTIYSSSINNKETQDRASEQEARYKSIVNGKWAHHGQLNAEDMKKGMKSDIAFVLNAAEHLDVILRKLGAQPIGTHTAHQDNRTFAAQAINENGIVTDDRTTSLLRKDYLYAGHLVTVVTNATVHR
ncbi:MAG TPA: hypothetical protein VN081_04865 [Dongiaceae bacterium]|nr:hypothetical protein [Dongiaceae bacterium]